jgi:phage terminase small subunit
MVKSAKSPAEPISHYASLTLRRQRLVDEYLKDLNGHQAARRAGYAAQYVHETLQAPEVQLAIKERREQIEGERAVQGARYVINRLWDVETADPRELVEIHKVPCRHCWGIDGQYQFTRSEMHRLLKAHELGLNGKPIAALWPRGEAETAAWEAGNHGMGLDTQGGDGYTTKRDPNPHCSECSGEGVVRQHIADTRKLSPQAQALYRGVKLANGRIELLMADQDAARDTLAKHYGVAVERKTMLVRHVDPTKLSDEELLQALAELEALNASITDANYEVIEDAPPQRPEVVRPE